MLEMGGLMAGKMEHGVNTLEGYAQSLLKLNMHLLFDPTSTFINTNTFTERWIRRLRVELFLTAPTRGNPNARRVRE